MSGKPKSGWDRVIDELRSPADWAAAIVGGAVGAGATIAFHGLDLGHSIPTASLAALGLRKSWVPGKRHDRLVTRAENLSKVMKRNIRDPRLIADLDYAIDKVTHGGMLDDAFEQEIERIEGADV